MKFSPTTVHTRFDSPLGRLLLAAANDRLVGVWFDAQPHLPAMAAWRSDAAHPVLQHAQTQLTDYLAGRRTAFDLPLDLSSGTPFQQHVWRALLQIPRGSTCSYGALSAAIGKPAAVRAVGCNRQDDRQASTHTHTRTHLLTTGKSHRASLPCTASHSCSSNR